MVICKFYQQGYCRYGDRCRFEHVDARANIGYSNQGYGRQQQQHQYQHGANQYRWQNPNPNQYSSQRLRFFSPQQNRQFMDQSVRHQQSYQLPMQTSRIQYQQNQVHHQFQQPRASGFSFNQKLKELESAQKPQTGFSFNRAMQQIQQPQTFQQVPVMNMMVQVPMANVFGGVVRPLVNPMIQSSPFDSPFGMSRPHDFGMVTSTPMAGPSGSIIPPDVDSGIYSSLSSLSLEEVEQYKAEKFEFQRIPVEPPPKELCF